MKKILRVAEREFLATAGTKAFIFGVLVTPIMISLLIFLMPRLMRQGPPMVKGEIAIVDPTGQVAPGVAAFLEPDRIAQRRQEKYRKMQEAMPPALRAAAGGKAKANGRIGQALDSALGEVPRLAIVPIQSGSDLELAKNPLKEEVPKGSEQQQRLALVVVHPDAVVRVPGKQAFGSYDLFVRAKLDDRVVDEVREGLRDAIVGARLQRSGLDRQQVDALTRVDEVRSRTVTTAGEGATNEVLNVLMPAAFMALLLISVLMSGQYLLTTTVEEKSNRVVEVLLSALSPMELMVGKILGQMAVGLLVLVIYLGLGLMALLSFASLGLLDPVLIVFLMVFYLLAYLTVGAFMAAIGSAVNEMREAQGLMTPVMLIIMVPWMLWMPISRDPNSTFATVLSFIPPLSNFVMMLRMASSSPPPIWQPLLAVVVGVVGACAAMWLAGKIFRIGLLMYGKPPTFATLVRWARMG
jgi:ABC-2 type transport system permease protein